MKKLFLSVVALLVVAVCSAQTDSVSQWSGSVRMGSSVVSGLHGETFGYMSFAPTLNYKATDRVTVKAGFSAVSSLSTNGYALRGLEPRSLAPRKPTTTAVGMYVAGQYQVNDRLWLAASVFHIGGEYYHPWLSGHGTLPLNATGVAADMSYRLGNRSYIDVHFSYIKDEAGSLCPLLLSPYYSHCSPFDHILGRWSSPYTFF